MLLKKGLENAPVEPKWWPCWKSSSFDVCLSGWQWSRKRCRPVLGWLSKPRGTKTIELGYKPRYWHWERDRQRQGFRFIVVAAPASNLSEAQMRMVSERLANCGPDDAERAMVEAVRNVSVSVPEVGPHCMSILLYPPFTAGARIRYIPFGGNSTLAALSTSLGQTFTVPAAFTPWLVGPGTIFAPSIASGNWQAHIGRYTIMLEAPELPGPGIRALFSSQQRPKLP